jgi:hypothetical protein
MSRIKRFIYDVIAKFIVRLKSTQNAARGDIFENKTALVQYRYVDLAANRNETVNMEMRSVIWILASLSSEMAGPCVDPSGLAEDFILIQNIKGEH